MAQPDRERPGKFIIVQTRPDGSRRRMRDTGVYDTFGEALDMQATILRSMGPPEHPLVIIDQTKPEKPDDE